MSSNQVIKIFDIYYPAVFQSWPKDFPFSQPEVLKLFDL